MIKTMFVAAALIAASAFAAKAEDPGDTSGPAAGSDVLPPTAVQKDNTHIPDVTPSDRSGPSGTAAGAPGVEAHRGTQAGKEWTPPAEIRKKPAM